MEHGFSKGLYLAGVECWDDAEPPDGWVKWTVSGFEYLRVVCGRDAVFPDMIIYLQAHGVTLGGAVYDFTCPAAGSTICIFRSDR